MQHDTNLWINDHKYFIYVVQNMHSAVLGSNTNSNLNWIIEQVKQLDKCYLYIVNIILTSQFSDSRYRKLRVNPKTSETYKTLSHSHSLERRMLRTQITTNVSLCSSKS